MVGRICRKVRFKAWNERMSLRRLNVCVPIKTSTCYFLNMTAKNRPIFFSNFGDTYGGHLEQFMFFCLSEISVVMWYNNWLFKIYPVFEGSNGNLIVCVRSAFHKVQWLHYLGVLDRLYIPYVKFLRDFFVQKNHSYRLIFV